MPNPGGGNQFGNYTLQPQYGDVAKQTALTREAPLSGSPMAAQALQAPRRAQKQATRGAKAQAQQLPPAGTAPQPPPSLADVWTQIARIPGASPLVQQLAADAQQLR